MQSGNPFLTEKLNVFAFLLTSGRISGVRESDPGGFLESGNPTQADFWSPGIRPRRLSGVRESDPRGFLESGNPEDGFLDSQVFKITESGRRNHGIRESGNLTSFAIADGRQTDADPAGNHSVHRTLRTLAIANATAQRARGPLISGPFQGSNPRPRSIALKE